MVHFYRNVFSHVPSTRVREVSHKLKAIHAQESREAADNKAKAIVDDLRASRMGKAAALISKQGSGLEEVTALNDARLKGKHIGIVAGTPPGTNMAANGLMANAKPYPLMVDTRVDSSAEAMVKDLASGEIDAGVLWGPMAGFYAKKSDPPMHVTPLVNGRAGPQLVYRIGMGVRRADQNWKRLLNRLIQENQAEINKILAGYGVPLLDENNQPIPETATKSP
jgi:ABC-type amino acid transport substrate-binding protein